jgi:hypothetical protein
MEVWWWWSLVAAFFCLAILLSALTEVVFAGVVEFSRFGEEGYCGHLNFNIFFFL